ncbi:DNA polymerase V [Macleaya cordata]|uniref:DNA polymerase V n=1 Tax=Macleaya cordata TaxID=56857 RepID=A0A200QK24_MACCD|nr:DNA polymerase V [Macleaya cordata]
MGGKKRSSDSVDELEDQIETSDDELTPKPSKILKKEKKEEDGREPSSANPISVKPMERRKKRKALDKEKHRTTPENAEVKKVRQSNEEFHISVFKDLASVDLSTREAAAEALVTELRDVQKAYEKLGKKGADNVGLQLEAEKDDGLENCATSLRYAVRRLIRGVSSSRECARQGFALGLTIVIGTIPCIKVDALMKLIIDILEVSSSMKGQEARDCLLGRLFAYGALARSGRIAEEWISNKSTPYVKEFTSLVISLASKKRYLREPAVSVILDLVEKLPVDALSSQVLEAPGMIEWFKDATDAGNPEALLLALKMREKISSDNEIFSKLLPYPFSPNKMFTTDHLSSLIPSFQESTFCQPRIHTVWPVLVNILLPDTTTQEEDAVSGSSSSKKHKKNRKYSSSEEEIAKNLRCFCEIVVEGSLLLSSHDRKHLAFDILLLLLPRLPASCVQIVLSQKLVHCLMDILSTKDSWLYKAAQYFLKEIADWVKNDDDRRVAVIVALQKHSSGRFDCITRTKTVKDLVGEFNTGSGCMLFVQNLENMFVDEGRASDEPSDQSQTTDDNSEIGSVEDKDSVGMGSQDSLKSWVIDSLPRVLKDLKLDPEAKFRVQKEILKFLAVQGLFSASLGSEVTSFELQEKFKWPKAATSSALCRMCIEQLQLLLANTQKGEGSPSLSNGLEPNDLGSYFMRFLSTLCNIPSISIYRPLSDEDDKAFKKLQEMETRLSREERNSGPGTDANKLHALRYLLIQLLLQVLLRPGEFFEAAFELVMCCKKSFPSPDLLDSEEDDELDDSEKPELMDVLVDTLLSLLPQSSPPLRSAVEQVFKSYCNEITDAGLLRMLRVIKKDLKPARHQATDSEDDGDGDDDDEDFLGIEEADEAEEADEDEAIETGDSDDSADDSEVARIRAAGEEVTEASDDSDDGMDDEAMFRMDSYLAQIFKEKKNQAAGGETAHSQLVLFKLRVLSLLEIYLHEHPGKPQVVTVYSYLAQAFVNPQTADCSDQLAQRIWGILQKKILKSKEYPKGEDIPVSTLESLLKKNLKLASKPFKKKKSANLSKKKQQAAVARHKMVTSLAQHSTFWLLKIIHARDFPEPELLKVLDIFQNVLVEYFDSKKSRLKPGFIKEVFQRQPWLGHKLFHFLLEKCGIAKSEFRRTKALDLVDGILKSLVSKKESGEDKNALTKVLKAQMPLLADLIWKLVINMPKKQSWRAQVRRFCANTFKVISMLNLIKEFLKALNKEASDACESQLGDLFLSFKKPQR